MVQRWTRTFDSVLAPLSRPALILSTFSRSLYESASSADDRGKTISQQDFEFSWISTRNSHHMERKQNYWSDLVKRYSTNVRSFLRREYEWHVEDGNGLQNADKTKDVYPSSRVTFLEVTMLAGTRREVCIFHSDSREIFLWNSASNYSFTYLNHVSKITSAFLRCGIRRISSRYPGGRSVCCRK